MPDLDLDTPVHKSLLPVYMNSRSAEQSSEGQQPNKQDRLASNIPDMVVRGVSLAAAMPMLGYEAWMNGNESYVTVNEVGTTEDESSGKVVIFITAAL